MAYERVEPPDELVEKLVQDSERLNIGLKKGRDSNAYHSQWASCNKIERGEFLFNFIFRSNIFLCISSATDPTNIIENRGESIDVTLVSTIYLAP